MDSQVFLEHLSQMNVLNQFFISLFVLVPMVLISRTIVAETRFSPVLIIVFFGLGMGFILVITDISSPGLQNFPIIDFISRTTVIALTAPFL